MNVIFIEQFIVFEIVLTITPKDARISAESADAGGRQLLTPRPAAAIMALQAQFSSMKTALLLLLINKFLIES